MQILNLCKFPVLQHFNKNGFIPRNKTIHQCEFKWERF